MLHLQLDLWGSFSSGMLVYPLSPVQVDRHYSRPAQLPSLALVLQAESTDPDYRPTLFSHLADLSLSSIILPGKTVNLYSSRCSDLWEIKVYKLFASIN